MSHMQPETSLPNSLQKSGKGFGIASLVLGIVALVLMVTIYLAFLGLICGIIGIILGAIARKRLPAHERGMATAGFVCSIVATGIFLLCVIIFIIDVIAD